MTYVGCWTLCRLSCKYITIVLGTLFERVYGDFIMDLMKLG